MKILLDGSVLKEDERLPEILPNTNLQDIGMNSILFIQLIIYLETTYSMKISDDDLLIERFASINEIKSTMEKYKKREENVDV